MGSKGDGSFSTRLLGCFPVGYSGLEQEGGGCAHCEVRGGEAEGALGGLRLLLLAMLKLRPVLLLLLLVGERPRGVFPEKGDGFRGRIEVLGPTGGRRSIPCNACSPCAREALPSCVDGLEQSRKLLVLVLFSV